jgi:biotin transport system substrate-specific component
MKSMDLALVALFATLTALGAFIEIPLPFVPITLQTFFILLSGLILGSRLAGLSLLCYVGMGSIGLPVFAGGASGIGVIAGPTGGYLVGFVIAAFVVGFIAERREDFKTDVLAMAVGIICIYVPGILQLMNFTGMGLERGLEVGIIPFIAGDIIKAGLAVSIANRIRRSGVLHISSYSRNGKKSQHL